LALLQNQEGKWERRSIEERINIRHLHGSANVFNDGIRVVDLDGDGVPEIVMRGTVAVGPYETRFERERLIRFQNLGRPPGDAHAHALPVPPSASLVAGTLTGATRDGGATCQASGIEDVWYYFTAPTAGTLNVDTCGSYARAGVNTVVSLHSDDASQQLACNDDGHVATADCEGRDSRAAAFLVAGDTALIRVSRSESSIAGPFDLHVDFRAPEPSGVALGAGALGALAAIARRRSEGCESSARSPGCSAGS
jgi:hypothetical protein